MKFSTVLALVAPAVMANAYIVPLDASELPQGASNIHFNAEGNAIVTPVTTGLESRARNGGAIMDKRDSFPGQVDIGCGGGFLEQGTEHNAWNQGVGWCNSGKQIGSASIQTWVDGVSTFPALSMPSMIQLTRLFQNSVWYVCNYGGSVGCNGREMQDAGDRLFARCGANQAGWVFIKNWNKTYGRVVRGASICDNIR